MRQSHSAPHVIRSALGILLLLMQHAHCYQTLLGLNDYCVTIFSHRATQEAMASRAT